MCLIILNDMRRNGSVIYCTSRYQYRDLLLSEDQIRRVSERLLEQVSSGWRIFSDVVSFSKEAAVISYISQGAKVKARKTQMV